MQSSYPASSFNNSPKKAGNSFTSFTKKPNYIQDRENAIQFLKEFVDPKTKTRKYITFMQEVADGNRILFPIYLSDLQQANPSLLEKVLQNTMRYVSIFSEAVDELLPTENINYQNSSTFFMLQYQKRNKQQQDDESNDHQTLPKRLTRRYQLVFIPKSPIETIPLRTLGAKLIGKYVSVKGIVTRCSDVRSEIQVATYVCDKCGFEVYQEVTSSQFMPLITCPSKVCKLNKMHGNLQQQTRGSKFTKFQEIRIQEMSDEIPTGNIPQQVKIFARGELTRKCSPGDEVTVCGVYLPLPVQGMKALKTGPIAYTIIEAMHIEKFKNINIGPEIDESIFEEHDLYKKLSKSIAPEIYGHEDVKRALLLMLVGGVNKDLDGVKIRGDINICLMGDPGVAKSQLLRYVAKISPRGIYTSGKGSSGVGLTAAVVKDELTGELVLEGGALVLADNGICCIDEFDKMEEKDRTALHEVMEQQSISIAKAGITTTLNARASILAAANPAYGRYNPSKSPSENINLPVALLSRFDLLWLILDKQNDELDLDLAKHITHVHQFNESPDIDQVFDPFTMRKIISKAKEFNPVIPEKLTEKIANHYVQLRADEERITLNKQKEYTTPRTLLSILRLSQALARISFRNRVKESDVEEAIRLITQSKLSLDEDSSTLIKRQDPISAVYEIIKQYCERNQVYTVNLADITNSVLAKGYKQSDIADCVKEYEDLGILMTNEERTAITFVQQ